MSTIYKVSPIYIVIRNRRRPPTISINGRIIRKAFRDKVRKRYLILIFIDDYNHFIGGVDVANKLRYYYKT